VVFGYFTAKILHIVPLIEWEDVMCDSLYSGNSCDSGKPRERFLYAEHSREGDVHRKAFSFMSTPRKGESFFLFATSVNPFWQRRTRTFPLSHSSLKVLLFSFFVTDWKMVLTRF